MRTSLFANGMAATYSNQEYFVVFKGGTGIPYIMGRGDARLLSKSGKYGLRLTDSGVLATSNSTESTNGNNWGALMHGLEAWGNRQYGHLCNREVLDISGQQHNFFLRVDGMDKLCTDHDEWSPVHVEGLLCCQTRS